VKVASTLSAVAYASGDSDAERLREMNKALAHPGLPTKGQWSIAWGPVTAESDSMYIAAGPGREYVVAIRGTVLDLKNLLQDVEVRPVPLPFHDPRAPADATISEGTAKTLERLQALRSADGQHALDFLKGLPSDSRVVVTGHSLGGCLASLVPIWLRTELDGPEVTPCTFAGTSAGNAAFASYFEDLFGTRVRFFNDHDIVPRAWNREDLETIKEMYPKPGPSCDVVFRLLVANAIREAKSNYRQPQSEGRLEGALYDESGLFKFEEEAAQQHSCYHYMYLTGVPAQVIREAVAPDWRPPGGSG
jgi:hypothetical protein